MTKIQDKTLKKLEEEFPHLEWLPTIDNYDSCGFGAYLDDGHDLFVRAADRFDHVGISVFGRTFDTEGDFCTPDFDESNWKELAAKELASAFGDPGDMKEEVLFNKIRNRILGK